MKFEDWLYEMENFGMRVERLHDDLPLNADAVKKWLRAAYDAGRDHEACDRAEDDAGESI